MGGGDSGFGGGAGAGAALTDGRLRMLIKMAFLFLMNIGRRHIATPVGDACNPHREHLRLGESDETGPVNVEFTEVVGVMLERPIQDAGDPLANVIIAP